ncbi:uncharacterized protein LOC131854932 isoform X1 [Achroia grisella]|uniref:uncharacterized protein LOC131854932 isoform X1 n=1 Tax=Achroia grisella TaxID=688607 RepID=UPI0027D24C22|nr:uncharacterized protein LOC131854932 isoform X1 [Achroia grisella]
MIDVINKNLRSLSALGQPTDHWDTLIIYIMSRKLDYTSNLKWEELRNDRNDGETLEQFFKFLNNRADLLHTVQYNKNANKTYTPYTSTVNNKKNKTFTVTTNNNRSNNYTISCALCKQTHHLFTCQLFRDLDVDTRIQKVNGYSICQNCLRPGHKENKCKLSHCKYCKEKHNTLLHKDIHTETIHSENVVLSTNIVQTSSQSHILLSTALVQVSDAQGRLHTARLLLDNGSTSHFITRQLCEKLGLVIRNTNSTISGINNQLTRTKWQSSEGEEMKVGAMVIVKDKVQPPLLWLLGRITKLSGSDTTRVAEIRTKTGIITRAYNNICVLPIY